MATVGKKVAYFNGIRLWQSLKHWKPTLAKGGPTRKMGTSRKLVKLNPHSPNFAYEIQVHTAVEPVAAVGDLGRQETFNLQMLQVQKLLVEASDELGDLSWCQDESEYVTVDTFSAPMAYPGAGTFTVTGSGFVPAAGQYVLFRKPSTGEGFVTLLTGAGGASFPSAIEAGWEMRLVRYYFPDTAFVTVGGWETATQAEDRHAFDVIYAFESAAHAVYAAGYAMTIS